MKRLFGKPIIVLLTISICAGGLLPSGCNKSGQQPQAELPDAELQRSTLERDETPDISDGDFDIHIRDNHEYTIAFYHQARTQGDVATENLLISPLSMRTAFAQAYAGARNLTEAEIADVMGYSLGQAGTHAAGNRLSLALEARNDPGDAELEELPIVLETVNAFWGRKGDQFQPAFLDLLAVNYGAGIYTLDFRTEPDVSRLVINDWVADRTRNRIEDLLPDGSIDPSTVAVLTNAVYFKAPWQMPFDKDLTRTAQFDLIGGGQVDAEMMRVTEYVYYAEGTGYQALEIPFRKSELGMVFLLPDTGRFAAFEGELTTDELASIIEALEYTCVDVKLPKFSFESGFKLKQILHQMGMVNPFTAAADFTGMFEPGGIYIDEAYHKTFIAVDETGAEAAGATAIVMRETSLPIPEAEFTADRPFLFFIRDRITGAILFMGRLVDPS